jgi:hypothetical protein
LEAGRRKVACGGKPWFVGIDRPGRRRGRPVCLPRAATRGRPYCSGRELEFLPDGMIAVPCLGMAIVPVLATLLMP